MPTTSFARSWVPAELVQAIEQRGALSQARPDAVEVALRQALVWHAQAKVLVSFCIEFWATRKA